jgi:hypothetical protein
VRWVAAKRGAHAGHKVGSLVLTFEPDGVAAT